MSNIININKTNTAKKFVSKVRLYLSSGIIYTRVNSFDVPDNGTTLWRIISSKSHHKLTPELSVYDIGRKIHNSIQIYHIYSALFQILRSCYDDTNVLLPYININDNKSTKECLVNINILDTQGYFKYDKDINIISNSTRRVTHIDIPKWCDRLLDLSFTESYELSALITKMDYNINNLTHDLLSTWDEFWDNIWSKQNVPPQKLFSNTIFTSNPRI